MLLRSLISDRIKWVRFRFRLTQYEFAQSIDVNYYTYRGYENCRSDVPIYVLVKIANLYHVSMDYLVGLE